MLPHTVVMAQPSLRTTVNSDAAATDGPVSRVEVASRGLLALSARAGMNLPDGISLAQLRALAAAEDAGPCTVSALADVLMTSTSSASRLVDRLAASGVLDRRTSEFSRREVTLEVTARGRRYCADTRRHGAQCSLG